MIKYDNFINGITLELRDKDEQNMKRTLSIVKQTIYCQLAFTIMAFTNTAFADGAPLCGACTYPINWSGLYIGPQADYAKSDATWKFPFFEYYSAPGDSLVDRPSGGMVGGHVGYYHQINTLVIGLEAAYDGGTISQDRRSVLEPTNFPNDSFETKFNDIGTLTARLGYAPNQWQVYAKGGLARARTTINALSGVPGLGVRISQETNQNGWTLGGGVEYMFASLSPNIILGLEYDFISLNDTNFATTTTGTIPGLPIHVKLQHVYLNMLSARVSVKFF